MEVVEVVEVVGVGVGIIKSITDGDICELTSYNNISQYKNEILFSIKSTYKINPTYFVSFILKNNSQNDKIKFAMLL